MGSSEFDRNRIELDIISEAGEKFYRGDQRMTLLYRLHKLPHRRTKGWEFVDQDFVLNVTIGDKYVLGQHAEGDPRSDHNCYFGHFGSIVEDKDVGNDDDTDGNDQIKSLALFGDCYSKYVDTVGHCQVEKGKSGLWIKDLGSEYGTFVNGVKLKGNVVHLLKSGDLISLGFSYEVEKPWMLEIGRYWIFKVYEVPVSEFEHRKDVATAAMENYVIVDNILSNFNYKELKTCRLVSPLWDEEARRKLRSRTRLVFPDNGRRLEYANMKLSALQNTGIWSISFEYNSSKLEFPIQRLPFFKNILANTKFTRTELDFSAESENVTSFFKGILSWSQLQEVTFNRKLFQQCHEFEQDFGACISVQKLIFNRRQSNYSQILKFFPSTTEIVLSSSFITKGFLNENYANQLDGLKVLEMSNYGKIFDPDEDHCTEICNIPTLICALSDSMQLTRLEMNGLYSEPGAECDVQALFDMLSKFKNSLQHLRLGLFLREDSLIQFPVMNMLIFLNLEIEKTNYDTSKVFASGFGSENFPRLNELEVFIEEWEETPLEEFLDGHFGSQSEFKNNSVRTLSFKFPNKKMKAKYSQLAENNFRVIFPNCVHFVFFCAEDEDSSSDEDL